ncbi:M16 family metallopeptidase [Nevskia soli]|uniref:M16 family metallopeptidase n=1 Tax=Nevskia soli TaxID=418856 RepID=UPI0015D83652|nr:pitrilysin family protein [Nevskia soli]
MLKTNNHKDLTLIASAFIRVHPRLISLFALLALTLLPAFGADVDIPYTEFTLDNGLRVMVHEDHKAPVIAFNIWYHVGSKNERAGKTGFAHLFEHLMFGGSENAKGRYIDYVERLGATDLNGTTAEDRTNYFETVPVAAFDRVLFLESDRMGHFYKSISKETLDLQRGVVQNEKRQGDNQPYSIVWETAPSVTYPALHPYSHTVIGSMEDLDAASLADVQNWFKTYYGPNNAVLAIAGDITPAEAKEKVTKYFGDIPPSPPVVRPAVWVAKMTGERRFDVQDRVAQSRLYKYWNIPPFGTADTNYLELAGNVLTNGKASRLYKRLVYDDHIATEVWAYVDDREIGGQFIISATVAEGHTIGEVERALNEEMARFLQDGPTEAEMDRVRTEWTADFVRGLQRVGGFGGKSDVLAHNALYTGDPKHWKITYDRMVSATPAEVKQAAAAWLSDGGCVFAVTPFPAEKKLITGVDRSHIPELTELKGPKLPKMQRERLSSGSALVVAERHDVPLVQIEVVLNAGQAADSTARAGAAQLLAALLTDGTGKRSALEISEEQQRLGAKISANSDVDLTTVRLSALTSKLDASLDLFADVLLNPAFPAEDFERERKLQLATIEQEKTEPFGIAFRVLPGLIYGPTHPYGTPSSGTTESLTAMKREDIRKFYETWFRPNNATIIVIGDTTLSEIRPKIESALAAWKQGDVPQKAVPRVLVPEKDSVYLIDKPDAAQTVIISGMLAPQAEESQEVQLETMDNIFGGAFGSRLNMNLREDKHWSYGAWSEVMPSSGQRLYFAGAPVQTDKTRESIVEVQKEIRGMTGARPITADELERAKSQEILQMAGARESLQREAHWIERAIELHLPDDFYDKYADRVKAVTAADVKDQAQTVIAPDHMVWLIIGDKSKIQSDVKALNLGDMHVIDADGKSAQ